MSSSLVTSSRSPSPISRSPQDSTVYSGKDQTKQEEESSSTIIDKNFHYAPDNPINRATSPHLPLSPSKSANLNNHVMPVSRLNSSSSHPVIDEIVDDWDKKKVRLAIDENRLDSLIFDVNNYFKLMDTDNTKVINHKECRISFEDFSLLNKKENDLLEILKPNTLNLKVEYRLKHTASAAKKAFLAIQELKAFFLRAIKVKLQGKDEESTRISNKKKLFQALRKIFVVVFVLAGMVIAGGLSYLALVKLIPLIFSKVPSFLVIPLAITFAAFESLIFCSFDGKFLGKAMGIGISSRLEIMNTFCNLQFEESQTIKLCLLEARDKIAPRNDNPECEKLYKNTDKLLENIDLNMSIKRKIYESKTVEKTSLWKRLLKLGVVMIAALGLGVTVYFGALAALGALLPALVGTPLGWFLVAFTVFIFSLFFLAMRGQAFLLWKSQEELDYQKLRQKLEVDDNKLSLYSPKKTV